MEKLDPEQPKQLWKQRTKLGDWNWFKNLLKSFHFQSSLALARRLTYRSRKENSKYRHRSRQMWLAAFWQRCQANSMRKEKSFQKNGTGSTRYPQGNKHQLWLTPDTECAQNKS